MSATETQERRRGNRSLLKQQRQLAVNLWALNCNDPDERVDVNQVAVILNCSERTVSALEAKHADFPESVTWRGRNFYRLGDVRKWKEDHLSFKAMSAST